MHAAEKIAAENPVLFDGIAEYYLRAVGDNERGYHFIEQAVKYRVFRTLEAVLDPNGAYPELKDNKSIYPKLKSLFRAPGKDDLAVGDLVSVADDAAYWGVVHDTYKIKKVEKLGILVIGWSGLMLSEPKSQCRKIRRATPDDLAEVQKYHQGDLHDPKLIDVKKILDKLKQTIG